jgi:NAD+ synthase (glutamine-hydrolysing)
LEPAIADPLSDAREVYMALVTGLRDYVRKNGFHSVVLGMSGGIDSALVAAIACDAVGPENVYGVRMPSEYSSEHSLADAAESAALTGMNLRTVPITDMVQAYHRNLDLTGLAAENLQARVRGAILMAISNSEGQLVLATGNKSELAVGYSTIYGDAVGGFAPIKDVPKTLVWEMARWRNESAARAGRTGPIPPNSIEKPPSAELRPGQLDTDSLPDYHELDRILEAYVGADMGATELLEQGFDPALVSRIVHLTDAAEWKRRQYPPGTKITFRAFGRDRRLPITNQWREPLD